MLRPLLIILIVSLVHAAPGQQGGQCDRRPCKFGHYCCSQVVWWWQHCCPNGVRCCIRLGPGCGSDCDDEEMHMPAVKNVQMNVIPVAHG